VGVHATPISTWDKTLRINARGTFLGCKYAITQMLKQDVGPSGSRGWIINMASVAGLVGIPGAGMLSHFLIFLMEDDADECDGCSFLCCE
jgi:NAD(P)-dependent dehydrogenase (short-subunit alcohol dehydrogenase family)